MENTVPGKLPPGIFPPMLLNIPTRFCKFFHYCHRYHWYYLKNCFVILCFKCQTWCGVKLEAEEWDVTQFNQINLNSSFSIGLLLINWKQLLRFGLLYCIKLAEDTARHGEKISNIFSSKVLFVIMVQTEFSPVNYPLSLLPILVLLTKKKSWFAF